MSEVVSIFGQDTAPPNQPQPSVVDLLKKVLAEAESGEVRAVAVVSVHKTGGEPFPSTAWEWPEHYHFLISGVACLQVRMGLEMLNRTVPHVDETG